MPHQISSRANPGANPSANLDSLRALQTISNVRPGGRTRTPRELDILTGDDRFEPTELEQLETQLDIMGDTGIGVPRETIRSSGLQALKRKLGLEQVEHEQQLERAVVPARVKGEYDVRAQTESAKAAMDRLTANAASIAERQQALQDRVDVRTGRTQEALDVRQQSRLDAQTGRQQAGRRINPSVLNTLARLRGQSEAGEPGTISSFFGAKNKYRGALDQAVQNAIVNSGATADEQNVARKIATEFAGVPFDEALESIVNVESLTQEEYEMINDLVLVMRGQ